MLKTHLNSVLSSRDRLMLDGENFAVFDVLCPSGPDLMGPRHNKNISRVYIGRQIIFRLQVNSAYPPFFQP